MVDIWIISWFNHTAFDANPIWKPPTSVTLTRKPQENLYFYDFCQILKLLVEENVYSASPGKTMQNHQEISSTIQFRIRNVEIGGTHKEHIPFLNASLRK